MTERLHGPATAVVALLTAVGCSAEGCHPQAVHNRIVG
jgi:hypothetical protein